MKLIIDLNNSDMEEQDLPLFTVDVAARLHAFGIRLSDITIDRETPAT